MKDEEIAEEKYCKDCKLRMEQCLWAWRDTNGLNEPNEKNCSCKEVPAFLAGLKAGRPQWHDLREDPNDLPKETKEYLVKEDVWGNLVDKLVIYNAMKNFWCSDCQQDIIAWCEEPTFDKE